MLPFYAQGGPIHPMVILLAALLLDVVPGNLPWLWRVLPHPLAIIGGTAGFLERKLNRQRRGQRDRLVRGALVGAVMTLLAVAIGVGITELRRRWAWGWAVELALVWMLLAQQSLFLHVRRVAKALEKNGVDGGRRAVALIAAQDSAGLDTHAVARAAIESCARNFADQVVGPVFWYAVFGMPGLLVCKTVHVLDTVAGQRTDPYRAFGTVAARLDDAVMLIPARIAGLLLIVAAIFAPRGRPGLAWKTMWKDHGKGEPPNAGWSEAAMAGALDLALAGPRRQGTELVDKAWIGMGRARATPGDIHAALYIFAVACLLIFGIVVGLIRLEA